MTDSPAVYTAHDFGDVVASLPTLFGFVPTESFIAISTTGRRRRFGFRLRQDMPEPGHLTLAAEVVAEHVNRHAVDGVVLVGLSHRVDDAARLVREVELRVDPRLAIIASGWAHAGRYWESWPGFPPDGLPYEDPRQHLAVVRAVAAGQQILPDRGALVRRFAACEGALRRRMEEVTARVVGEAVGGLGARAGGPEVVRSGLAALDLVVAEALDAPEPICDVDVARLALWTSSAELRDELWSRIDQASAPAWLRLWTDVASRVVPPFEPAVLSLASFAAWLTGDGAQARIAAERAVAADPDYAMASLMVELLDAGVPPWTWASWSPVRRGDGAARWS